MASSQKRHPLAGVARSRTFSMDTQEPWVDRRMRSYELRLRQTDGSP